MHLLKAIVGAKMLKAVIGRISVETVQIVKERRWKNENRNIVPRRLVLPGSQNNCPTCRDRRKGQRLCFDKERMGSSEEEDYK